MKEVILASTSPYRRKLLEDLGLSINCIAPTADENDIPDTLPPKEVAMERAKLKTLSIAKDHPQAIVIGGDQLVSFEGKILGKPHTAENAVKQLSGMSGKTHELMTALVVAHGDQVEMHLDITKLTMRSLTEAELKKYVELDQPLDCAGAYKIESRGRWLFEKIESEDETAIQGLPLQKLAEVLHAFDSSPLYCS